jgi:hypothetical protein
MFSRSRFFAFQDYFLLRIQNPLAAVVFTPVDGRHGKAFAYPPKPDANFEISGVLLSRLAVPATIDLGATSIGPDKLSFAGGCDNMVSVLSGLCIAKLNDDVKF